MNEPHSAPLGAGLTLEERLPLACRPLADADEARRVQPANEQTLRTILSFDEHHHAERSDEDPALAQEFARLESRINLVLEMVSQVLAHQVGLPPTVAVHMSADTLAWQFAGPAPGGAVLVEIYVSPRYPRPLLLPATVEQVADGWARARFGELGDTVQDQLEQLLFRHHRRQVAASRRGG